MNGNKSAGGREASAGQRFQYLLSALGGKMLDNCPNLITFNYPHPRGQIKECAKNT